MRLRPLAAAGALCALAACDSDNAFRPSEDQPPSLVGDWRGTVASGIATQFDAVCAVSAAGGIGCALFDPSTGAAAGGINGTIEASTAGAVNGSALSYPGASTLTLAGTIEGAELELEWSGLVLVATRTPSSPASIAAIAGTHELELVAGEAATLTVGDDGALTAQSAGGCVLNGTITPSTPGYRVSVTLAGCPTVNGELSGFALERSGEIVVGAFGAAGALIARGGD